VVIRPLQPADRELLAAAFERLSPESRYRRFFAEVPRLTEHHLDYLTHVDQHDHVALIAIDEATGQGIGVARFVRTGPGVAEPAIAVVDHRQGHGVGSALLGALVERAREEGITRFVAPVLADNAPAIHALERLGDTTLEHHGPEVELTIELPVEAREPAFGMRELLRAVAEGTIQPALVFWHRLLLRRGVPRSQLRNVIVAAEGKESVALAGDLAAASGASLVVAAARSPLGDDPEDISARLEAEAGPLRGRVEDLRMVVRRGDLGAILLDEAIAEQARLIVVADPKGDDGVTGRLLGSVWDHVSHHAPCDVLIARGAP
jgi:RimJ/RimL family protein N-acetyltransferase/nucleotide-binding universal stress UspA family protein